MPMNERKRLSFDDLKDQPWFDAFKREFDLVQAENLLLCAQTGDTLYNDVLDARLTEFAGKYDGGLQPKAHGVVAVTGLEETPSYLDQNRLDEALAFLRAEPRGAWAIAELRGRYDVFMSDGIGGLGTPSGYKFTKSSPTAPELSFETGYASVISMMSYLRRNQIENDIFSASFDAAGVKEGTVILKDVRLGGKQWSKIEMTKVLKGYYVGGSDAVQIKASQRGRRPESFIFEKHTAAVMFDCPLIMPAAYKSDDGVYRLQTMLEQRETSANSAYGAEAFCSQGKFDKDRARWEVEGDTWTRNIRDPESRDVIGTYTVHFKPGSGHSVIEAQVELNQPAPAFG